jgi:hypothetical protein
MSTIRKALAKFDALRRSNELVVVYVDNAGSSTCSISNCVGQGDCAKRLRAQMLLNAKTRVAEVDAVISD